MSKLKKIIMKYVLCEPDGGLNDVLGEIKRCLDYCLKFDRTLVVDTRKTPTLMCDFTEIFEFNKYKDRVIPTVDDEFKNKMCDMSIYPHYLKGKLYSFPISYFPRYKIFVSNGTILSFDFKTEYEEDILFHHQHGGGPESFYMLKRLKLSKDISDTIKDRVMNKGKYDAIHVRFTDYKSDYKALFNSVYDKVSEKKLLVCSDSKVVLDYAQTFFDKSEVIINDYIDNYSDVGLHTQTKERGKNNIIESLVDLFSLALSENLYFSDPVTLNDYPTKLKSGFSALANLLKDNKDVLYNLFQ